MLIDTDDPRIQRILRRGMENDRPWGDTATAGNRPIDRFATSPLNTMMDQRRQNIRNVTVTMPPRPPARVYGAGGEQAHIVTLPGGIGRVHFLRPQGGQPQSIRVEGAQTAGTGGRPIGQEEMNRFMTELATKAGQENVGALWEAIKKPAGLGELIQAPSLEAAFLNAPSVQGLTKPVHYVRGRFHGDVQAVQEALDRGDGRTGEYTREVRRGPVAERKTGTQQYLDLAKQAAAFELNKSVVDAKGKRIDPKAPNPYAAELQAGIRSIHQQHGQEAAMRMIDRLSQQGYGQFVSVNIPNPDDSKRTLSVPFLTPEIAAERDKRIAKRTGGEYETLADFQEAMKQRRENEATDSEKIEATAGVAPVPQPTPPPPPGYGPAEVPAEVLDRTPANAGQPERGPSTRELPSREPQHTYVIDDRGNRIDPTDELDWDEWQRDPHYIKGTASQRGRKTWGESLNEILDSMPTGKRDSGMVKVLTKQLTDAIASNDSDKANSTLNELQLHASRVSDLDRLNKIPTPSAREIRNMGGNEREALIHRYYGEGITGGGPAEEPKWAGQVFDEAYMKQLDDAAKKEAENDPYWAKIDGYINAARSGQISPNDPRLSAIRYAQQRLFAGDRSGAKALLMNAGIAPDPTQDRPW